MSLAVRTFEFQQGRLPSGQPGDKEEMIRLSLELKEMLGVNNEAFPHFDEGVIE